MSITVSYDQRFLLSFFIHTHKGLQKLLFSSHVIHVKEEFHALTYKPESMKNGQ